MPLYLQILLDKNTLAEDFPRFVQSYQNPIGIIRHLGRNYDKVDFETREIDIGSPWILEHKYSWANQYWRFDKILDLGKNCDTIRFRIELRSSLIRIYSRDFQNSSNGTLRDGKNFDKDF